MLQTAAAIAEGTIPDDLEVLAACGRDLLRINAKVRQTISVIVAAARDRQLPAAWATWCVEHFELDGSDRSHAYKVGKMLLNLRDCNMRQYQTLFAADFDKLLAISRIPFDATEAFVSHLPRPVAQLSRAEVRAAVAAYLGEQPAAADQPELPGFDTALGLFGDVEPDQLRSAICDDSRAALGLRAGIGLLGAALEFERRRPVADVETLATVRAALLSEVADIDSILAGKAGL